MMTHRRLPTTFEWIGLIATLGGVFLVLGVHFVKTIQAFDMILERQERMAVEICLLTTTVDQRMSCERRVEAHRP